MWLFAIVNARESLIFGYSLQEIEWRRPLRNGFMLPFWRGAPVVQIQSRRAAGIEVREVRG